LVPKVSLKDLDDEMVILSVDGSGGRGQIRKAKVIKMESGDKLGGGWRPALRRLGLKGRGRMILLF